MRGRPATNDGKYGGEKDKTSMDRGHGEQRN